MKESISIFDIFKIGVGPSSSHTMGPWKAGNKFAIMLQGKNFDHVEVHLFGSLSKTGKGHCTDIAVQLGLASYQVDQVDTELIGPIIADIALKNEIQIAGKSITFVPKRDIVFNNTIKEKHPNTLIIKAFLEETLVLSQTFYSVGGGFIELEGQDSNPESNYELPYPIDCADELLAYTHSENASISELVLRNELSIRSAAEVRSKIQNIFETMLTCVYHGSTKEGILPGGLGVRRRAKSLASQLMNNSDPSNLDEWISIVRRSRKDFITINNWVSCFALAVNEENADLGRVVTSPTNGAAGVIPAVLLYFYFFFENDGINDVEQFLLTAGEIACIFKKGATISAAVGGCQAEIGVSSAMAAAGLTEVLGGTPQQVLMAAEIAMEHHLGLTCDPIGGLVQIPCIERNTMGAIKAITACNLALGGNPDDAKVKLDVAVKTMWDTAQEMNEKYKETSEGGLAFNLPVIFPEC